MSPLFTSFLLLLLPLPWASRSQPNPNKVWCSFSTNGSYTPNGTFQTNLNALLSNLSSTTPSNSGFLVSSSGSVPVRVFGLSLCRGDVSNSPCRSCLDFATSDLPQLCPYNKDAVAWYDNCLVRYSSTRFAAAMDNRKRFYMRNTNKMSSADASAFNESIVSVLDRLREYAVNNATSPRLFALGRMPMTGGLGGYDTLYGLVQCTRDITAGDCDRCLKGIFKDLPRCCAGPAMGGRVIAASCNFIYEVYSFTHWSGELYLPPIGISAGPAAAPPSATGSTNRTDAAYSGDKKNKAGIVLAIVISISVAVVLAILTACICFRRRKIKMIKCHGRFQDLDTIESLLFDLATIRCATNDFSLSNKLGEGGFGSVYKGVLPDGQEIAVKRISRESLKGEEQLKNELLVLAKLQHRNLVRIYGVCFEGGEKMLVYEYVANKSLDTILFDPIRKEQLNWERRYKIITGIARGLQYLHEESQMTIIHRDLKVSNILLDSQMNPKISDFGTARLFGEDQTQALTDTIVGTFGYMPPEYVIRGRFSSKTDVFSFGVLVLEIIMGRKRNNMALESEGDRDLLSFVWRHWCSGSTSELVDYSIRRNCHQNEVQRCIQIGLLCVQKLPSKRPTMSSIVLWLNSHTISIQKPMQSAFLSNHSKTPSISQGRSSSNPSNAGAEVYTTNDVSLTELEPR